MIPCGAEKVVGTATPTKDQQENKVVWKFSTGDVLTVLLGNDLNFQLQNESSEEEVWPYAHKFRSPDCLMYFIWSWS